MVRWLTGRLQSLGGLRRAVQLKAEADKAVKQREYATARSLYEASLERFRQRQHWQGVLAVRLGLGNLARLMQDYASARSHFEQCVNLARNFQRPEYIFAASISLAQLAARQGDVELAGRLGRECLELSQTQKNMEWSVIASSLLGSVAPTSAESRAYHKRALDLCQQHGSTANVTAILCSLGHSAEAGRDNSEERTYLEECIERCRGADKQQTLAYALNNLGNIERYDNHLDQAAQLYRESLVLKQELGDEWAIAYTLEGCAMLAIQQEQAERAVRLFGAASGIWKRLGTPLEPSKQAEYEANVEPARYDHGLKP